MAGMGNGTTVRPVGSADTEEVLDIVEPVIRGGETYAIERDLPREEIRRWWFHPRHTVRVAVIDGEIAGTYYLQANQRGPGSHVANCGYITAAGHRGKGVARAMCSDSLALARDSGFTAMQFNLVVAANEPAVRLWTSLGFATVGRIPAAFEHPSAGFVDALVMHRGLE